MIVMVDRVGSLELVACSNGSGNGIRTSLEKLGGVCAIMRHSTVCAKLRWGSSELDHRLQKKVYGYLLT